MGRAPSASTLHLRLRPDRADKCPRCGSARYVQGRAGAAAQTFPSSISLCVALRLAPDDSGMIVTNDVLQWRKLRDRMRGKTPGDDRGLDAAFVEAAVGPVPGDRHVVISVVQWRDPMLE